MANRSSLGYAIPREDARVLALTKFESKHHEGEVRRLFIDAHRQYRKVKTGAIRRADVGVARGTDQDDGAE